MDERDWYEIIGISLFGPPPLGAIHIPWTSGINVLYGRNGVGKTRILEALLAFERRRELPDASAFLHVRYDPSRRPNTDSPQSLQELAALIAGVAHDDLRQHTYANRQVDNPKAIALDSFFADEFVESTLGDLVDKAIEPLDRVLGDGLNVVDHEIAQSRTLSLGPTSGIWASARIGENTPQLETALAETPLDPGSVNRSSLVFTSRGWGGPYWLFTPDWPSWAPVPLKQLADVAHDLKLVGIMSASGDDPDQGSNETVRSLVEHLGDGAGESDLYDFLDDFLERWSRSASNHMKNLMVDAPDLMIELLPLQERLNGQLVAWNAWDRFANDWLPLFAMSSAQRKWADVAIYLGLSDMKEGRLPASAMAAALDEPEEALHPAATEYVLQALQQTATTLGGPVVLASHSPQVLGLSSARLLHVDRDPYGSATVTELTKGLGGDLDDAAARLGLRRLDLLQVYRVFLVVEGLHDSTVLENLFPGQWDENRIRLLHMRGTRHVLDLAASEILRDFSDAHVVVLLDDVAPNMVDGIKTALDVAKEAQDSAAKRQLNSLEERAGNAERKAIELARQFLSRPYGITVKGLIERDIIEYLDPAVFGLTADWKELRKQHRADGGPNSDFKEWLRRAHGARINKETLAIGASRTAGAPPAEMETLYNLCVRLATGAQPGSDSEGDEGR